MLVVEVLRSSGGGAEVLVVEVLVVDLLRSQLERHQHGGACFLHLLCCQERRLPMRSLLR